MPDGTNSAPGFAKHPDYKLDRAIASKRVCAMLNGVVIADSDKVMVVRETGHGPVYYFPREDVRMYLMEQTENSTH